MVVNESPDSTQQETTALPVNAIIMDSSKRTNSRGKSNKSAMDIFNESVGEYYTETDFRVANNRSTITEDIHNYRKYVTQFSL